VRGVESLLDVGVGRTWYLGECLAGDRRRGGDGLPDIFAVGADARNARTRALEHDSEKWKPVFAQDHAQTNNLDRDPIQSDWITV